MEQLNYRKQLQIIILPINKTQNYAWGCKNKSCLVGFMSNQNFQTYAQFWMGTHPNGESKLSQQKSLKQYLKQNDIEQINFLFKILSIEKCLSIQAHPNQQQAKQLNEKFPQIYVDNKDKPQMFLTLSDKFQLFLGFIDQKQLQDLLKIEPFKSIQSQITSTSHQQKLLRLLEELVNLKQIDLQKNIKILLSNASCFSENRQHVLKRIFDQFKYDTGILVSCLLQYHILQKGQCFGIQAGVPHAYIKGQCFELMKNSDNVVRLGLTPKKKDTPNLLKIISNNIDKKYCKIEKKSNFWIQKFLWKQYSIIRYKLSIQQNFIQINSDSIGIILNGQTDIVSKTQYNESVRISSKTVFFIKKGIYTVTGSGQIFIACKF